MWHEGIAQRGANEISSCVYKFIMDLPNNVEKLILYSDTCPGQNRNNILPIMFKMALHQKESLTEIHHKFLVPGHTHLECDSDHALIERFLKKHNTTISVPQDWMSMVKMASNRFDVKYMTQVDFFGFSELLNSHFMKSKIGIDRLPFAWNSIFWLMYKRCNDVAFKYSLHSSEPFRFFSMYRRGRHQSFDNIKLSMAYSGSNPIDVKKYKDILDLLPFIDPIYHDFYKNLTHSQSGAAYTSDSEEDYN